MKKHALCMFVLVAAGSASCRGGPLGPAGVISAGPTTLHVIVIDQPLERWARDGFVEMAPTVRSSVAAGGGAETRVFLRVPDGALVTMRGRDARTLLFPPGTESDRVSYVLGRSGQRLWIDDVRGTRWDESGREYFHVYLPRDERVGASLVGVEWLRDDAEQERLATDWLVDFGRAHRAPPGGSTMDEDQADRFRMLNHCQMCHVADKPEATTADDPLPPWPTDSRGLYAPLGVLSSRAILSSSPSFDDPNAGDPFMRPRCPEGAPRLHGGDGYHWFSCRSGMPTAERDLHAAMKAADAYASRTCRARRYLVEHMDASASAVYRPMLQPCPDP